MTNFRETDQGLTKKKKKRRRRRISEGDGKQVIRKIYVWYLLCFSCPSGGYSIDDGLTTKFFYLRKLK